ncbi:MAG TPA: hypothetical protein DDW29_06805 [Gammaproteobacteria bacterium]|nr:hypothetical protein [Gammaproteobacteria bacterium]|tara:strand:- start:173 stop:2032 length:1860 start_codon:yes stop_codon:yes gene_type:complete
MSSIAQNTENALNLLSSPFSESKQHRRLLKIYVDGYPDDAFIVNSAVFHEQVSKPFQFKVDVYSEKKHQLDAPDMIGVKAVIVLEDDGEKPRYFHGHISSFTSPQRTTQLSRTQYKMVLSPWLQMYEQVTDCRIFQNAAVMDVIQTLFKDITVAKYDLSSVTDKHYQREFWVQYNETIVNFFNRICQAEGIGYYYTHTKTGHTLHLIDTHRHFQNIKGHNPLKIQPKTAAHLHLTDWGKTNKFVVSRQVQTSYNALSPTQMPSVTATGKGEINSSAIAEALESYRYSEYFNTIEEGNEAAGRANKQSYARLAIWKGKGDYIHLTPGYNFRVTHVPADVVLDDANQDFTLLSSMLTVDQLIHSIDVSFSAVPLGVLVTPTGLTPVISGLQTAVVTGDAKIGTPYTVDSEKLGRVKVQFHWDREGKRDSNTTCWLRVMNPMAGPRHGAHFTPRIGQEVVVAFENGNPDYPFILGALYNGENQPPFIEDHGFRSGFRTATIDAGKDAANATKYNELSFYDKKGQEEIRLRAEKDFNAIIQGNKTQHIMQNDSQTIDQNLDMAIGDNLSIKAGSSIALEASQSISIQVGGSSIEISSGGINIKSSQISINGSVVNIGSIVNLG